MKCTIPEIFWHNRDPVLSVDIQPKSKETNQGTGFYRLASGGTDSHVLIWYLSEKTDGLINFDLAADLTRHQRAVNCVRWSPSGEFLASGDDESVIFIWKLRSESEIVNILETTNDQDKEIWLTFKILRGHMEDVYDLSWSPNSLQLISGSVDNTAMIWNVKKGKHLGILNDHKSFVQGVSWDPKNQYLATLSADRCMRVFDVNTKKIVSRSNKSVLPVPNGSATKDKVVRLYHDDTLQTFYRRLSFSPDGEILVAPSGIAEFDEAKSIHTTYLYTRYSLKQPAVVLPSPDQYTVAVRFCPLLFELHVYDESNPPLIELPYRMIFALATKSSVYLYDTQQKMPFGIISNIHYTRLTDLTWSSDGKMLLVSSTDGFCTLIMFADGELGKLFKNGNKNLIHDVEMMNIHTKSNDKNIKRDTIDQETEYKTTNDGKTKESPKSTLKAEKTIETNNSPKLIAIRHKPRTPPSIVTPDSIEKSPKNNSNLNTSPKSANQSSSTKIIISDKNDQEKIIKLDIPETIISSEEKFCSPEIKNKPVTPIQIRRIPKNAGKLIAKELTYSQSSTSEPQTDKSAFTENDKNAFNNVTVDTVNGSTTEVLTKKSQNTYASPNHDNKGNKTPRSNKKATPIAIRRQPRTMSKITNEETENRNSISTEDAALDAWPIDETMPELKGKNTVSKVEICKTKTSAETDDDTLANIRLFYEDSQDQDEQDVEMTDASVEHRTIENDLTPNSKAPRRVELKTISTPKSKKKL